jgi:predicted peptidase
VGLAEKYHYLVDLPEDYHDDSGKTWPLILFLASAEDRGNDMELVRESGLAGLIHKGKRLPAIVISPQCPSEEGWNIRILSQLLDEVSTKYRVDADRVYVTGISAGGDATWALALAHPERFAAIVPICGDTDPLDATRLKSMPIWAFHGMKDDVVPVSETTDMIEAIRKAGGHPHLTLFPEEGHHTWNKAYSIDELYTWLLAQKRNQPEVITPGIPSI